MVVMFNRSVLPAEGAQFNPNGEFQSSPIIQTCVLPSGGESCVSETSLTPPMTSVMPSEGETASDPSAANIIFLVLLVLRLVVMN